MGMGEKHHMNFHLRMPHLHHSHHHHDEHDGKKEMRDIPKGSFAVMVGQGEERQRFVIPVMYINHPLFMELLKESEEEYGFDQQGPIAIPCHVEEFRNVQGLIDKEMMHFHNHHHHHHHQRV